MRRRRPLLRASLLAAALSALTACALYVQREASARSILGTVPIGQQVGGASVLGAVEWRAVRPDFGGFSGLALDGADGFVALTDKAHWAQARMIHDMTGALVGIEGLEMGRLDGEDGTDLMIPYTDSEALTRAPDGSWLIGFEGRPRIGRFATLRSAEETLPPLEGAKELPLNGAFESVVVLPDGRIAAVAESPEGEAKHAYPGWIVEGETETRFTILKDGWYAPTDMAMGPDGKWVYLLERRFTLIGGFAGRVRRFPLADLRADARIEPTPVAEIDRAPLAENYEGLATALDAAGRTILYIISDDNFRLAQRTLLVHLRVEE